MVGMATTTVGMATTMVGAVMVTVATTTTMMEVTVTQVISVALALLVEFAQSHFADATCIDVRLMHV